MSVPRHVAVIPDGNRRWAEARGMAPTEGHRAGIRRMSAIAAEAFAQGVEVFSFWWGSPANLEQRAAAEVEVIVGSLGEWLVSAGVELLRAHDARFEMIGRWRELCPSLTGAVEVAHAAAGSGPCTLAVLMAYDGRDELVAAAKSGVASREALGSALWTAPLGPVDLVIRTGEAPHLSAGFMLWQIAEAQLHFSAKLWPDFGVEDFRAALAAFAGTERRFGR